MTPSKRPLRIGAVLAVLAVTIMVLALIGCSSSSTSSSPTPSQTQAPSVMPTSSAAGAGLDGFSPARIYAERASGVVLIVSTFGSGAEALGSGFVVSGDGTILTNAHVVTLNGVKASAVRVAFRRGNDQSSKPKTATLVGVDQTSDIAVLKVDPGKRTLTVLPMGDSSEVVIGEWVVAIGNPLGYSFSLSQGIVSGVGRDLQAPNGALIPNGIQTDAAINQGNSGGPLLNAAGNVIGINEQIASTSGTFSGLGFAIPINMARTVMEQILQTGSATHAYLGVSGITLGQSLSHLLHLPTAQGVLVQRVQSGSAAAQAGIRDGTRTVVIQGASIRVGGDIITTLNGRPLLNVEQLASAIARKQPGDKITLTLLRDGKRLSMTVTLGQRPAGQ